MTPCGHIPLGREDRLLTVVPTEPSKPWSESAIRDWLHNLEQRDDVSHTEFRACLLFCGSSIGSINLGLGLTSFLRNNRIDFIVIDLVARPSFPSRSPRRGFSAISDTGGPYVWKEGRLHLVYKIYEDKHGAFLQGLQPSTQKKRYRPLYIGSDVPLTFSIAVPTRYPTPTGGGSSASALANKRILVKDIFKMDGLKISACNKAYLGLAREARYTAPTIQCLIDAGAVIVGKARLSSMISREEPNELLDFQPPMNPRADGRQSPAGSSSGSAAGIAAYDWLDFAIGSDSTGSTRRPAMANGVYSLRITTHVLPPEGMMPCFGLFDTPSVLTRDLESLSEFVRLWCGRELDQEHRRPTSIFVPQDFAIEIRPQAEVFTHFTRALAAYHNLEIRTDSLVELWVASPPPESCGEGLRDFLKGAARDSFFYDFYHTTDKFRNEYWRKYRCQPAVNQITGWRWDEAEKISIKQRDDAVRRLDVYKDWLREQVLTDTNPLVILPVADAEPKYRDDHPKTNRPMQEAWDQLWLAPILGAPELTVPIGQVPYHSRISKTKEYLPVVASILGKPRTDLSLIGTAVEGLRYASLPTHVLAGKQIWEPGR
ncbi:putative amidase [Septoria linicola]|nr:putative amidase [Septoria linicola]